MPARPLLPPLRAVATWFVPVAAVATWLVLLSAAPAASAELEPVPDGVDARSVAARVEDVFRGKTSFMRATMTVTSPRLPAPREVAFESWDDRPNERSFIRIERPAKDQGMAFLKLEKNLWNYIPRVERTMRVPPSMMLNSWMGSDFTNDDLVRESSQLDDYEHTLLGVDPAPEEADGPAYVLQYVPHEDAPVVWGKIVTWVDVARGAPIRQEFFDEAGVKLRVMTLGGFEQVQGRPYPRHWKMIPLDKAGHETRIDVSEIRFDEDFPDAIFTKRNLRTVE